MKTFAVTIARYDYHGDSRSPYWRWSDVADAFITATDEDMTKYVNEFNSGVVANTIVDFGKKITEQEEYIDRHEKRAAAISALTEDKKKTYGVVVPDASIPVRARERITEYRNMIERLETNSLETIINRGWIEKMLHAEEIEIQTIEQFDASLRK